jgi:hypothetical protein
VLFEVGMAFVELAAVKAPKVPKKVLDDHITYFDF